MFTLYTPWLQFSGYPRILVPPNTVPGAKVGLPNIVTLISAADSGCSDPAHRRAARIFYPAFICMSAVIPHSLAGGLLSLGVMALLLKEPQRKLSLITISLLKRSVPQPGQLTRSDFRCGTKYEPVLVLSPFLMLLAIPTQKGIVVGNSGEPLCTSSFRKIQSI